MDSGHGKKRMDVEGDRLSSLPDDLIHKILSFVDIKHAIKTSALSSRWRYIWTSMPALNFSDKDFHTLPEFSKFVTHVLSRRNNQIEVSSAKLTVYRMVGQSTVKRILDYAFSHNVQQLNITFEGCILDLSGKEIEKELPLFLLRSQSLEHLTLNGCIYHHTITTMPTWELPTLVTLNLHCIALYDDSTDKCAGLFSNCVNLKNLTLKKCKLKGLNGFNICHPGLSSLTLKNGCQGVNVVTPQLKNLIINNCRRIYLISVPNLSFLHYKAYDRYLHDYYYIYDDDDDDDDEGGYDSNEDPLMLSTDLLHLEKADICINRPTDCKAYTRKIVCLLQQLHRVKFLTLNWELVKHLSASVELISHQPSPFVNLRSLKIYPVDVSQPEVTMSTEVKNYLLDGSPCATFTMVSRMEIRDVMNVTSLRNLMTKLRELLDEWKENNETNTAHKKQDMATMDEQVEVENHKMKWYFGERMRRIERYWEDLSDQYEKGRNYTRHTISMVRKIKEALTKVPISRRAKLQARFSDLCAEAENMMDITMDRMEMQCNKKPRRSNVCFHELATSSHPPS